MTLDLEHMLRHFQTWQQAWKTEGIDEIGGLHILDVEAAINTLPNDLWLVVQHLLIADGSPPLVAADLEISRSELRARAALALERLSAELDL